MSDTVGSGPRCVALVGPYLSGKTTLLEAMLAGTGAIRRKGSVKEGNMVGDASAVARKRQMSVELNIAHCQFMGEEWTILDADISLTELRRTLGTTLPEGGYKTMGGFLTSTLGQIPAPGELLAIGEWEIEVLDATPRKVLKVRIRRSVDIGD